MRRDAKKPRGSVHRDEETAAGTGGTRPHLPWRKEWPFALALFVAVVLAYEPAWHAGFMWDDDWHLTANPCIVGPLGFKELWTTREAKICPLVQTTFWLEHAAWGLSPRPYHLANIFLHAASALLLWRVLRRLDVPGAGLGAALWALHPVQVESVAWVTELKNVQSGFFFLLCILCFANFIVAQRAPRRGRSIYWYLASFLCAALAMASKSSTVILPLVLALCAWWLEGTWRWCRVWNLLPFLPLSAASCALSIWTQRMEVAAFSRPEWTRSWPERIAVAGKVVWFYLDKLAWPHPLIFFYPRCKIDPANWTSYVATAAVVVVLAVLWYYRRRWARGPFFAFAYFLAALLPVLGLVNHYFIRYSFVGDHFQYLACMGILALAGAAIVRATDRCGAWSRLIRYAICLLLLVPLTILTWWQSHKYVNSETLYETTIAQNPGCWLAHYNLAHLLEDRGEVNPAIEHYRKAVELKPADTEPRISLATALDKRGETDAAIAEIKHVLDYAPNCAMAHYNLGRIRAGRGDMDKAMELYRTAIKLQPEYAEAHNNLGGIFAARGQFVASFAEFELALASKPDYPLAHWNFANALAAAGRMDEARQHYEQALAQARAHNDKALVELILSGFTENR